jgi:hypothetical protein
MHLRYGHVTQAPFFFVVRSRPLGTGPYCGARQRLASSTARSHLAAAAQQQAYQHRSVSNNIRVPHWGQIQDAVIESAFRVLNDFEAVDVSADGMKVLSLKPEEQGAFATGWSEAPSELTTRSGR